MRGRVGPAVARDRTAIGRRLARATFVEEADGRGRNGRASNGPFLAAEERV